MGIPGKLSFHARSNVMLNLALGPLNTKESDKSLCLASASASNELQKMYTVC